MAHDESKESSTDGIRESLAKAASQVEDLVDVAWRRTAERLGLYEPQTICAYRSHATADSVHVRGRVLANEPQGGPTEDDRWWDNLAAIYQRFASRDVPGAEVRLEYRGQSQIVRTDEEGYYAGSFDLGSSPPDRTGWRRVRATVESDDGDAEAIHEIVVPGRDTEFLVVSDLDDTVIHTGVTSLLLMARLTFLSNARTRTPLPGVSQLYQALRSGPGGGRSGNPVFYVSSSPWNLYDLLSEFLNLNDIPKGPLLLQDFGIDESKFIKPPGHGHKLEKVVRLLNDYPTKPVVLLGDSGEEDARLYLEAARGHRGRVRAIYIRDVDPDLDSERDRGVDELIEEADSLGVPMIRGRSSLDFAEHAATIGLLDPGSVEAVARATRADLKRPSLTEETTPTLPPIG